MLVSMASSVLLSLFLFIIFFLIATKLLQTTKKGLMLSDCEGLYTTIKIKVVLLSQL